jgi:hypothetical protein
MLFSAAWRLSYLPAEVALLRLVAQITRDK